MIQGEILLLLILNYGQETQRQNRAFLGSSLPKECYKELCLHLGSTFEVPRQDQGELERVARFDKHEEKLCQPEHDEDERAYAGNSLTEIAILQETGSAIR